LQELKIQKLRRDDTLPTELWEKWQQLYKQLDSVGQLETNCLVLLNEAINIQIYGYADA
jgi:hypothetical protein